MTYSLPALVALLMLNLVLGETVGGALTAALRLIP